MLIISHVIVGATLARAIPNPWIVAPIAFASHFLLDMIPHAQAPTEEGYRPNSRTYIFVGLDLVATAIFLFYFGLTAKSFVSVFASVLPDILDVLGITDSSIVLLGHFMIFTIGCRMKRISR